MLRHFFTYHQTNCNILRIGYFSTYILYNIMIVINDFPGIWNLSKVVFTFTLPAYMYHNINWKDTIFQIKKHVYLLSFQCIQANAEGYIFIQKIQIKSIFTSLFLFDDNVWVHYNFEGLSRVIFKFDVKKSIMLLLLFAKICLQYPSQPVKFCTGTIRNWNPLCQEVGRRTFIWKRRL